MSHLEFRSAWGTNVLDLDGDQLGRAKKILDAHSLQVLSIGSPIGKIFIDEDFDAHLDRARHAVEVAHHSTTSAHVTSGSSPSSSARARNRTTTGTRCCAA